MRRRSAKGLLAGALRTLAPIGIRRLPFRERLRRRHGLRLGPDFVFSVSENVAFGGAVLARRTGVHRRIEHR